MIPRGRREIASGSLTGNYDVNSESKGDSPGWMIDCKQTEKKSYSVKVADFRAIEKKAVDRVPALWINFTEDDEHLVVLREEDVVEYARMLEEI